MRRSQLSRRGVLVWALVLMALMSVCALAQGEPPGDVPAGPTHRGWLSILPPLLAIGLALAARQVIVALLVGLWVGAIIVEGNPLSAFLRVGDRYLVGAIADSSHASIILFTTVLGGMVGVLSRSGATAGIVHWNLSTPALYEHAIRRNEAKLAHLGPLVVRTGLHTGRAAWACWRDGCPPTAGQ